MPESPTLVLDEARTLRQEGNWSQAIAMLEKAEQQHPHDRTLNTELKKLEAAWEHEKRLLEDKILVTEMTSLRQKIPLLEKLSSGESNNVLFRSRLLFWQKYLDARVDPLLACGIYHGKTDTWLAKQCLNLADSIAPSEESKTLLAELAQRIEKQQHDSINRRAVQAAQERKREVQRLLIKAKNFYERGAYRDTLSLLHETLHQDPENAQARRLLSETQSALNRQVESLVRRGDRLYGEEQILPAVSMWETALELDPDQREIGERIDRARRVLEKLEAIRSRK